MPVCTRDRQLRATTRRGQVWRDSEAAIAVSAGSHFQDPRIPEPPAPGLSLEAPTCARGRDEREQSRSARPASVRRACRATSTWWRSARPKRAGREGEARRRRRTLSQQPARPRRAGACAQPAKDGEERQRSGVGCTQAIARGACMPSSRRPQSAVASRSTGSRRSWSEVTRRWFRAAARVEQRGGPTWNRADSTDTRAARPMANTLAQEGTFLVWAVARAARGHERATTW